MSQSFVPVPLAHCQSKCVTNREILIKFIEDHKVSRTDLLFDLGRKKKKRRIVAECTDAKF